MPRICIYSGSTFGRTPAYARAAAEFGTTCARRGLGIVYGGGSVGLMGAMADAALAAGGKVIGVIPRIMIEEERGHHALSELIPVDTMHERKARMAELSDFFVALPGGLGTLEELAEVLTWLQLGFHLKPVGVLNMDGFYDPLLRLLDHMRDEEFLLPEHRELLIVETEPEALLDRLATSRFARIPKPIHRQDRQIDASFPPAGIPDPGTISRLP